MVMTTLIVVPDSLTYVQSHNSQFSIADFLIYIMQLSLEINPFENIEVECVFTPLIQLVFSLPYLFSWPQYLSLSIFMIQDRKQLPFHSDHITLIMSSSITTPAKGLLYFTFLLHVEHHSSYHIFPVLEMCCRENNDINYNIQSHIQFSEIHFCFM